MALGDIYAVRRKALFCGSKYPPQTLDAVYDTRIPYLDNLPRPDLNKAFIRVPSLVLVARMGDHGDRKARRYEKWIEREVASMAGEVDGNVWSHSGCFVRELFAPGLTTASRQQARFDS